MSNEGRGTEFPHPAAEDQCICGADETGEALDERPDCPVHGADAPYDPAASDIGEDPY
jgi:hypothetical protein